MAAAETPPVALQPVHCFSMRSTTLANAGESDWNAHGEVRLTVKPLMSLYQFWPLGMISGGALLATRG